MAPEDLVFVIGSKLMGLVRDLDRYTISMTVVLTDRRRTGHI